MSNYTDDDVNALEEANQQAVAWAGRTRLEVEHLRAEGCPWSVIGRALGVTKQAAQQRYGRSE